MLMNTVAMCTSDQEADRDCHSRELAVKIEPWLGRGVGGGYGVPVSEIQAFDNRRQVIVRPDQIREGDWLRDLGTLRQVTSVEEASRMFSPNKSYVLRFAEAPAVPHLSLSIPSTVEAVTVWRTRIEAGGVGCV